MEIDLPDRFVVYFCVCGAVVALSLWSFGVLAEETKKPSTVIGIDLGTTYSCVGVYKNGNVKIITNDQGNRITPSYVAFSEEERLIGDAAKNQATSNPKRTIYDVKRLIGRKYVAVNELHIHMAAGRTSACFLCAKIIVPLTYTDWFELHCSFKDKEVQRDAKMVSYDVVDKKGKPYVQVEISGEKKTFSPEEISAMILGKMKETAGTVFVCAFLHRTLHTSISSCPAF